MENLLENAITAKLVSLLRFNDSFGTFRGIWNGDF